MMCRIRGANLMTLHLEDIRKIGLHFDRKVEGHII